MRHPQKAAIALVLGSLALTTVGGGEALAAKKRAPKAALRDSSKPATYTVKRGDTLAAIADKLDTTIDQLAKDNKLKSPYRITPGDVLKGPAKTERAHASETRSASKRAAESAPQTYVVEKGDTLYAIGRKFDLTADELAKINGLRDGGDLRVGQKLSLAAAPEAERPRASSSSLADDRSAGVPTSYEVRRGDTLASIARKLGTTQQQLIRDNGLKKPYRLKAGEMLDGPPAKAKAPAKSAKAYVVESGDTLSVIARRFGVEAGDIARANDMRLNAPLRVGQKLALPSDAKDSTARAEPPPSRPSPYRPAAEPRQEPTNTYPRYTPPPVQQPVQQPGPQTAPAPVETPPASPPPSANTYQRYTPPPVKAPPPAMPQASAAQSDSEIAAMGKGRFIWPLQGPLVSSFGEKSTGVRNDGLNIRTPLGTPVKAAAAGEVVYAGDQVPGFGNLVLIKHADGWVTAYSHLSRAEVKIQQQVAQGQEIGLAGSSGGVSEPQLHFEVRYAASTRDKPRPINPALILP